MSGVKNKRRYGGDSEGVSDSGFDSDATIRRHDVKKHVTLIRKIANEDQLIDLRTRLAAGEDLSSIDYVDLVEVEEPAVGDEDALTLQAKDFLHSVRTGEKPYIDADAGSMAIRTAERIMETAMASGTRML